MIAPAAEAPAELVEALADLLLAEARREVALVPPELTGVQATEAQEGA